MGADRLVAAASEIEAKGRRLAFVAGRLQHWQRLAAGNTLAPALVAEQLVAFAAEPSFVRPSPPDIVAVDEPLWPAGPHCSGRHS